MVERLNLDKHSVGLLDFSQVDGGIQESLADRERSLQERSGIELDNDFERIRENTARDLAQAEMDDLYKASETSLTAGVPVESVESFIKSYKPTITEEDVDSSLEISSASMQSAEAFEQNEHVAINSIIDRDFTWEDVAKDEIFTTMLERLKARALSGSLVEHFGHFVESGSNLQALNISGTVTQARGERTNVITTESTGNVVRGDFNKAYDTLSLKDFKKYCDDFEYRVNSMPSYNKQNVLDMVDAIEHGGDYFMDTAGNFEAIAFVIGSLGKAAKMAKRVGNVVKLSKEARNATAAGDTVELAQEYLTKNITKPQQTIKEISSAGRISEDVGDIVGDIAAEDASVRAALNGIYNDKELGMIAAAEKEKITEEFAETAADAIDVSVREMDDGALEASVLFGSDSGKAMTAHQAEKLANNLGISEYNIVKKDAEGYFVEAKRLINDVSLPPEVHEWNIEFNSKLGRALEGPVNWVKKNFLGVIGVSEEAYEKAVIANRRYLGALNEFTNNYQKSFANLGKEDKKLFRQIHSKGLEGKGKWFTKEELVDMGASDAVQKAYFDFKKMSDIEWNIMNNNAIRMRTREGYREWNGIVGKKVNLEANIGNTNMVVRDAEGNFIENLADYGSKDYTLIKLDRQFARNATHVLLPNLDLQEGPITRPLVMYQPGGRRPYSMGTVFVKIGSNIVNPKTGNKVKGYVRTITTANNWKDAQKTAEEINEAIRIAKESINNPAATQAALDAADFKFFKCDSYEDLKALVKSDENPRGILDLDYEAQAVMDGSKYRYSDGTFATIEDIGEADAALEDLLTNRQQYIRKRGNLLDSVNDGKARILDVEDIYNRTIQRAARTDAYGELYQWYGKELEKFKDVIENWNEIKSMSPKAQLENARVISGRARALGGRDDRLERRAAEAFINHGKRILNARTATDKAFEYMLTATAKAVDAALPQQIRYGKVFNKIAESDPRKLAKSIVFHWAMNFTNMAQVINQGLGSVATLSMGKIHKLSAPRAVAAYLPWRLALACDKGSKFEKTWLKAAQSFMFVNDETFSKLLKLRDEFGGRVAAGLQPGATSAYGQALAEGGTIFDKIIRGGQVLTNETNGMNYMLADIMAVIENADKPIEEIAKKSNELFMFMTRDNASAFQAGKTLIPFTDMFAQWTSYPVRLIETLGTNKLTKAQKLQLWMTQLAMFGVGGTLLTEKQEVNMYDGLVNAGVDKETVNELCSGFAGAMFRDLGIDFNQGARLLDQVQPFYDLYTQLLEGKIEFPDTPSLAAVSDVSAMMKAIKEAVFPTGGMQDWDRYIQWVTTQKDLPGGVKNWARLYTALVDGRYYNSNNKIVAENLSKLQAGLIGIGMKPIENRENSDIFNALTDKDKVIKDGLAALDTYIRYMNHYGAKKDLTEEEAENFSNLQNAFTLQHQEIARVLNDNWPGGEALRDFDALVAKQLERSYDNLSDSMKVKAYKELPYGLVQNILRKKEEIQRNATVR